MWRQARDMAEALVYVLQHKYSATPSFSGNRRFSLYAQKNINATGPE
jgi:hypothetical protein